VLSALFLRPFDWKNKDQKHRLMYVLLDENLKIFIKMINCNVARLLVMIARGCYIS